MSAQYDNSNRGALFRVDEKRSENGPDFTGKLNVAGKDWELSAWERVSKAGKPYLSVSVRKPLKGTFQPRGYSREMAEADVAAKFGPGAYIDKDKTAKRMAEVKAKPALPFDDDLDDQSVPF